MAEKLVVANSTPLINFATIDRLDILRKLFKHIIVPPAVWKELTEKGSAYVSADKIKNVAWIKVISIKEDNFLRIIKLKIDEGEAEAIALAIQSKASLVLLDEIDARDIAQNIDLNVIGTIGCLLLAKKLKFISEIKPLLDKIIKDAKFWINKELYKKIISDK